MSYTYKGTKITGTSTNDYIFSKSGISNAQIGQTYFNTSTGHVYSCTEGGKASVARWKYVRTDIAKKPSVAVSSLGAPTRASGTHDMTATWRTPAAMVDQQKGNRATALDIKWYLGITGKDPSKIVHIVNEYRTESTINLNNLKIGNKTYTRSSFYPFNGKPVLHSVSVTVVSKNSKGSGASAKSTREFLKPRKPTISDFTFNSETGEVSCTINTDAGNDYHERYDTRYKMYVYYSNTKKTEKLHDDSTTSTSKTIKFDDANYASRSYGDYAKVTVKAWARGYKGDSEVAEKIFYVTYPAQASITKVHISSKDSTGKCTIYVNTHSSKEHPVDRVKLEYLANSDYADANSIPGDASWEETEIVDDATCKALAISVSNLIPDRGKYTWLRLKTYHANETVLYRYSEYWRVKDLETPAATAVDDRIKIISTTAGADGQSAVIHLAWDDGDLQSTGTELSWDMEENAWKSTKDPDSYKFSWSDGPIEVDEEEWPNSATITIKGLDEASKYFVKARRYNEGEAITYSEYSNTATVVTSEKPESVTATANRYVPKGSGLNVYWTFAGNSLQKEWQIVDSNGTILANGDGSLGSTQISADRLEAFAENGDVTFTVQVSTGSGYVVSEEKTVTIIEKPVIDITGNSLVHVREEVNPREFTGDIVTFETESEDIFTKLQANFSPIQDLHGYDKPWVGGAGKNLFDASAIAEWDNYRGLTITKNSDGSFILNGTATVTVYQTISVSLKAGTYMVSGCPLGGSTSTYSIFLSSGVNKYDTGSGEQFTLNSDTTVDVILPRIMAGTVCTNLVFKPMICLASTPDPTTYAPYSNLCPITGWTGCEVVVSPTEDAQDGTTYPVSWQTEAGTVYGGTVDVVTGVLTAYPYYTSYNGETLVGPWVSSMDEYIEGRTPTTGAQVVDLGGTPTTYQLTPTQIHALLGQNNVWADCGELEVKIVERIIDEDRLKTNDLSLSLEANKLCDLKVIVTSQGCVGQFPQGILRQTAGDTIHSDIYTPVWEESEGVFITTISLPPALDFWDLGTYTVSIVGIDRQTNLQSEPVTLSFPVQWEHQAPSITPTEVYTLSTDTEVSENKNYYAYDSETQKYVVVETEGNENPSAEGWYEVTVTEYVTLVPIDEIDDNGFHHMAVQINLTPPPDYEESDVYDIYRMTGDGASLIGESFPLTFVATDEYAPFGEDITGSYRIAVRTEDGDVSFSDIEYVLEGDGIRLDWAEGFLEFPYSVSIGDSYEKDVEIRKHLNGGINGYWNQGVKRKGDLSTDAIKVIQQSDIDLTRQLARYTGPVFVRTREGTAFEGDVQVTDLSTKNIAVMSIALDATEIDLTEEFMLPIPFELNEEGTE